MKQMNTRDRRKTVVYLDNETVRAMGAEARRQDRSLSWIARRAFTLALPTIRRFPDAPSYRKAANT